MSKMAVYKTKAVEFLDDFFSGDTEPLDRAYDYSIALLEQPGRSLSQIIEQFNQDREGPRDAQDVPIHWLKHEDVERIMRAGHLEAMKLAREHNLPMDTLWITGAGDDFEVHVCQGERRVTVLVSIPEDPPTHGSERAEHSKSFVFGVGAREGLRAETEPVDAGDPPVVRIQVSGSRSSPAIGA